MSNYPDPRQRYQYQVDYARLGIEKNQCTLTGETVQERKNKLREDPKMELPVKEHKVVLDGQHEGVITAVMYRDTPLPYTDYILTFEEGLNVKASYPTNITPETIHGRMLIRFGLEVVPNKTVDPNKLIGLKCVFSTVNKTTPKGTFPEVMRDTLKPAPVQAPAPAGIPVGQPAPGKPPAGALYTPG